MRHRPVPWRRALRHLATAATVIALAGLLGCGDDGGDADAFCATATGVANDPALLDPELTTEQLDRLVVAYAEMEETAPSAVRGDVEFLYDAVQRLREGDVSFAVDEEQAVRLTTALDAVSDYVREDCP